MTEDVQHASLSRRNFLTAAGSVAALGSLGLAATGDEIANASGYRTIWKLPAGHSHDIAWTVDDGADAKALGNFLQLADTHSVKLTFFVTSGYAPWRTHRKLITHLAQSGRIQLANHTQTHEGLIGHSAKQIQHELRECEKFIEGEYGVNPRPFFRPPYGSYNSYVQQAAADIGYTTNAMWNSSIPVSARTKPWMIRFNARKWMHGGNILIDHANWPIEGGEHQYLLKLLRERSLTTRKLNEIFK